MSGGIGAAWWSAQVIEGIEEDGEQQLAFTAFVIAARDLGRQDADRHDKGGVVSANEDLGNRQRPWWDTAAVKFAEKARKWVPFGWETSSSVVLLLRWSAARQVASVSGGYR